MKGEFILSCEDLKKENNPKNFANLPPEERQRLGHIGGKKAAETRKRKRVMKEVVDILLSKKIKDEKKREMIKELGINSSMLDNQMLVVFNMFKTAISTNKNNVKAAEFLRDTLGENPAYQLQVDESLKLVEEDDPLTISIKESFESIDNEPLESDEVVSNT